MKDKDNNEVNIGDEIEVLEIYEGLRQCLTDEEFVQVSSLKNTTVKVEEITKDGYANVGKWVDEGDGNMAYHGVSLLPHEFRLVRKAS